MSKILLAVVSDLHCGSTLGLSTPTFIRDDGETYVAGVAQNWLWHCWLDYWDTVKSRMKRGDQLVVVVNGDVTDGPNHHGTNQTVSSSYADEIRLAKDVLRPALALKPRNLFMVRGTPSHVGVASSSEETVAQILNATPDGPRSTWNMLPLELQGNLFHFYHHGKVGRTRATRNNPVINAARDHFLNALNAGQPYPHYVVKSHMHQYADSHDAFLTRCIQTPGWQLATAYIDKVVADMYALADIGGLLFHINNGTVDMEWIGKNKYVPAPKEAVRIP